MSGADGDGGGSKWNIDVGRSRCFLDDNMDFGCARLASSQACHTNQATNYSAEVENHDMGAAYMMQDKSFRVIYEFVNGTSVHNATLMNMVSTSPVLCAILGLGSQGTHKFATADPDPGDGGGSKWSLHGDVDNDTLKFMASASPILCAILVLLLQETTKLATVDPDPGDGGGSKWSLHGGRFFQDMTVVVVL